MEDKEKHRDLEITCDEVNEDGFWCGTGCSKTYVHVMYVVKFLEEVTSEICVNWKCCWIWCDLRFLSRNWWRSGTTFPRLPLGVLAWKERCPQLTGEKTPHTRNFIAVNLVIPGWSPDDLAHSVLCFKLTHPKEWRTERQRLGRDLLARYCS